MKLIKFGQLILLISVLLVGQVLMPATVQAGATLSFSPSSKTMQIGESWTVKVMVSANQAINSGTIKVTYSAAYIKATTIDCGSDFPTPIAPSIANGSASISCARFSSFTGTGHFASVTFQATAAGTAALGFGVSTIVANDGQGTNVYTGGGSGSVVVASATTSAPPPSTNQPQNSGPAPTQAPVVQSQPTGTATPSISSSTHPDQGKWFKDRKVDITWTKTANEFNYAIDQTPNTQLDQQVKDGATSYSQTVSGDGAWYAHVRAKSDKGWSNTAHYKLQIDASAPTNPAIKTDPASPMKVLPTINFSSEDSVSGVDFFEIKLDGGEWKRADNPYKPERLTSGDHSVVVRATDRAGNTAETKASFTIVPLAAPTIDSLSKSLLMLGEQITIAGTAPADTQVEIYINGEKRETVTADKSGRYTSKENYLLFPGTYKITAKALNADGITSPLSEAKTITIDAQAVSIMGLVLPGWGVFGLSGIVMVLLLLGLLWLAYRLWNQTRSWAGRLSTVNQHLGKDFAALESDLLAIVDGSLATKDPQAAEAIKADITKQIDELEDEVETDLKKVGSASVTVTARESKAWYQLPQVWITAISSKLTPMLGQLAGQKQRFSKLSTKNSPKSSIADDEKTETVKEDAENSVEISDEAEKTLAQLEHKATQKSEAHKPDIIPEIGDILAPEKDNEA